MIDRLISRGMPVSLSLCLVLAIGLSVTAQAQSLDQSFVPTVFNQGIGIRDTTFYRGQTFTVAKSGLLTRVEIFVNNCSPSNTADIILDIRAGTDFTNPSLRTGIIPATAVPFVSGCGAGTGTTAVFAGIDLSSMLQVVPGEVYTIWAHSSNNADDYGWWGDNPRTYSRGTARTGIQGGGQIAFGFSVGFKTFVLAVAEPVHQSFVPTISNQGIGIRDTTFYRGQTFTVAKSGLLTRVAIFVNNCSPSNTAGIIVDIRAGTDFTNPSLGTGIIPATAVPFISGCGADTGTTAVFAGINLSSMLRLVPGEVYTIWAHSSNNTDEYGWWGTTQVRYLGGTARTGTEGGGQIAFGFDVGFKTFVLSLDQSFVPTVSDLGVGIRDTTFYRGQTFTVGELGILTRVELFVKSCSPANTADVIVDIRAGTDFHNPSLGTGIIPASAIPSAGGCGAGQGTTAVFVGTGLGAALQVAPGEVYTIWAHSSNNTDEYGWWGDEAGGGARTGTDGGGNFQFGFGLGFRTYVLDVNTPTGDNVVVEAVDTTGGAAPATLTFGEVTIGGVTKLVTSTSGPPVPSGFALGDPPTYYDLTTTATFVPPVTVCIDYTGASYADEGQLKLLHFEGGSWVDRTASLNTAANIICAITDSLSPFAISEVLQPKLTVAKVLVPSTDTGRFDLQIDGVTAGTGANVGNGGTTGAIVTTVGNHTVGETAQVGTNLSGYLRVIGGACASDGSVMMASGENKTCTITNTRALTALTPANIWLGLKNSDDVGTNFDGTC